MAPRRLSHQLRDLLLMLRYFRDPYATLQHAYARQGDLFSWPLATGPMVITGDPEIVRAVFAADPDSFEPLAAALLAPVIGESNVIVLSGERHRAMRKLQTPPFHSARMRAYGALIHAITRALVARWQPGEPFCMHRSAQDISLEVILQAVLGLGEPVQREAVKEAILGMMASLKPSFLFVPWLRRDLLGLSAWSRFQRAKQRIGMLLLAEFARRRANPRPREDILSLLMAARFEDGTPLSDVDLVIQAANLVVAGHETTASALAWACELVHRDERILARLRDELAAPCQPFDPEAVARQPYLDAVCAEALRINPVAPVIGRVLTRPMTVPGYELPAGLAVGVSALLIHHRADLYPDPEHFRPERFLERSYTPFEYFPFGGGARRCLGAAFALYEMKIALATILNGPVLRLLDPRPSRAAVRNTIVGPKGGVPMVRVA